MSYLCTLLQEGPDYVAQASLQLVALVAQLPSR